MSQARVFAPQEALESWLTTGRAEVEGDLLTLDGERFRAVPSVRFLAEVAGGGDRMKLVGLVKSNAQLDALGAEHSGSSVVLGDDAYEVVEGYSITPQRTGRRDLYARLVALFSKP